MLTSPASSNCPSSPPPACPGVGVPNEQSFLEQHSLRVEAWILDLSLPEGSESGW